MEAKILKLEELIRDVVSEEEAIRRTEEERDTLVVSRGNEMLSNLIERMNFVLKRFTVMDKDMPTVIKNRCLPTGRIIGLVVCPKESLKIRIRLGDRDTYEPVITRDSEYNGVYALYRINVRTFCEFFRDFNSLEKFWPIFEDIISEYIKIYESKYPKLKKLREEMEARLNILKSGVGYKKNESDIIVKLGEKKYRITEVEA